MSQSFTATAFKIVKHIQDAAYKSITVDDLTEYADPDYLESVLDFLEKHDFIKLSSTADHEFVYLSRRLSYLDLDKIEAQIEEAYSAYLETEVNYDHIFDAEENSGGKGKFSWGIPVGLAIILVTKLLNMTDKPGSLEKIEIPPQVLEKMKLQFDSILADSTRLNETLEEKFPVLTYPKSP